MAIVYQISLHGDAYDARGKSWSTVELETGCTRDKSWRDPLSGKPLRIGEFGCAVSHLNVWKRICNSAANGIILEEDAVFSSINVSEVDHFLGSYAGIQSYDSVWLGYRENTLGYWYNCHAYAITPETARRLIKGFADNIIPSDEWVPLRLKHKNNYFYPKEQVTQIPRSVRPSTIEGENMNTHVLSVGTDISKTWALTQSSNQHGIRTHNIGYGVAWGGGDMTTSGGGQKINLIREHIKTLPDNDLVLFVDGYDVFFADNIETITERFQGFNCDILFAAEKNCWPDDTLGSSFPETGTPNRYLNSGVYMGNVLSLKRFFNASTGPIPNDSDDQLWMQKEYLSHINPESSHDWSLTLKLDTESYIFQCDDANVKKDGNQLFNPSTNCYGCIYHGNGGDDAKLRFENLAKEFNFVKPVSSALPAPTIIDPLGYEKVAQDILLVPLFSEDRCRQIIALAESHGNWGGMAGDKFPAQEIRAKEIGLWEELEALWTTKLGPIAEKHWTPMQHVGLRDAFAMRYALDTQTELGFHTDASMVTGSVKLNNDYDGGELIWPHQEFSNKDVPVGHCVLFPGQVTHGHKVDPLRLGKKYSLTMWTSRYEGDKND